MFPSANSVKFRHREVGSVVVEFALVATLLLLLLLGILQVGVYLHVRNVVAASVADGARYAASADVEPTEGVSRTGVLIANAVGSNTARRFQCSGREGIDRTGLHVTVVRCAGKLPVFFAPAVKILPLDVSSRAVEERR